MKNLIGQQMMIGLSGKSLTAEEKNFLVQNNIGGVILFSRNVESPQQVHALCSELQSLRHQQADKAPLLISIDMEGGRVARLKQPFTIWPPLKKLGDIDSPTTSFHFAYSMGRELKAVGINLDFAPCIDTFTNPANTVIGDRAVSTDPEMVARHASALIRGYMKAEVIPCGKHFPGHGHTVIDSHDDLPVEDADLQRLHDVEMVPFKKAFRSRLDLVMTAHIKFKNVDSEPVTFSSFFLKKLLREELRYRGLIITDDLDMKALSKYYSVEESPIKSLEAGANMLLYCNNPESHARGFESVLKAATEGRIKKDLLEQNHRMALELKTKHIKNIDPEPWAQASQWVGHPEHQRISEAISKGLVPSGLGSDDES